MMVMYQFQDFRTMVRHERSKIDVTSQEIIKTAVLLFLDFLHSKTINFDPQLQFYTISMINHRTGT